VRVNTKEVAILPKGLAFETLAITSWVSGALNLSPAAVDTSQFHSVPRGGRLSVIASTASSIPRCLRNARALSVRRGDAKVGGLRRRKRRISVLHVVDVA
jgi:hypothetical protein